MKVLNLLKASLSLFDEGAPAPAAENGTEGVVTPKASKEAVVYGKQEDGGEAEVKAKSEETDKKDPHKEFEAMIKGDYKEAFDTRVKDILERRFKNAKGFEKALEAVNPVLDLLEAKYGTRDVSQLQKFLDADVIEELAYKNDMTPENYRRILNAEKIERERAINEQNQRQQEQEDQMIADRVATWQQQAQEMKSEYPDFDLRTAIQDDQFLGLLKANVPVKTAFEIMHFDNLKAQITKDAQTQITANIQAKKQRPNEAAKSNKPGVTVKADVGSLNAADRTEIAKRVLRGEKITF